jgi:hypothetical protein
LGQQLAEILGPLARDAGLEAAMGEFKLGWEKLPFYAAHHVDELLIVDPEKRSVSWLGLSGGEYQPIERSTLIALGPSELAERIDWP